MKLLRRQFKPCCGYFLQGAVKWICYTNFLQVFVGVCLLILDMYQLWGRWHREKVENYLHFTVRYCIWIAYWLHLTVAVIFDGYLFKASRSRNRKGLLICMVATFFGTTWTFVVYYFHTYYFGVHVPTITIYNGYLFYRYYTCIVLFYYVKEIRDEYITAQACRQLTDEEIREFEEGLVYENVGVDVIHHSGIILTIDSVTTTMTSVHMEDEKYPPDMDGEKKAQYSRYKKEDYEIPLEKLIINEKQELGSGAFGKVFKAQLITDKENPLTVAVKTINHEFQDVSLFKALLSELKIMSYLGKHDHIVSLLGACTTDIKIKKMYIVVELCPLGSLYDFLRGCRGLFMSLTKDGMFSKNTVDDYANYEGEGGISTKDLLKWSYQTAGGMSFLESKKVIHSDLAARNILLTGEKNVKITDFGLSRQLYQYAIYVKKQNTPLPWRWLALESMADMNFSSKSDVWSFGVAIWEIFSLGESPWPHESFSFEFIKKLKDGMRMVMPVNCTNEIYNILVHCWHNEPEKRPSFQFLQTFFKEQCQFFDDDAM